MKKRLTSVTWPSGTARRLLIVHKGFDIRLEPIVFDIYIYRVEEPKLTSQSSSITVVEFSVLCTEI